MIKIITDSSADLPKNIIEKYDITVVPLTVRVNNKDYRDGEEIQGKEFFEIITTTKEVAKTSQINQFTFEETYKKFPTDDVISIHISSKISGTYNSAVKAKENLKMKNIHVIDSLNTTILLGSIIVEICKRIEKGYDLKKILELIPHLIKNARMVAVVDDLKYLKNGGRLTQTAALIGALLHIKPIMSMRNGNVLALRKVIGLRKAYLEMQKAVATRDTNFDVYFGHGFEEEKMKYLRENFFPEFSDKLEFYVGSTVGAHTGPCLGVVYFKHDSDAD